MIVALPLLLGLSAGCYKIDYTTGHQVSGSADEELWRHRLVWGMIELDGAVQLEDLCAGGDFSKIHTEVDALAALATVGANMVASTVTVGLLSAVTIYAPSNVDVWCRDGTAYRATVTPNGAVVALEAPLDQAVPAELGVFSEECSSQ